MNISFISNHITIRSNLICLIGHSLMVVRSIWSIHIVISSIWMNVLSLRYSRLMHLSNTNILRRNNLALVSCWISIHLVIYYIVSMYVWVHLHWSLLLHLLLWLGRHSSFLWTWSLTILTRFSLLPMCLVASLLRNLSRVLSITLSMLGSMHLLVHRSLCLLHSWVSIYNSPTLVLLLLLSSISVFLNWHSTNLILAISLWFFLALASLSHLLLLKVRVSQVSLCRTHWSLLTWVPWTS